MDSSDLIVPRIPKVKDHGDPLVALDEIFEFKQNNNSRPKRG